MAPAPPTPVYVAGFQRPAGDKQQYNMAQFEEGMSSGKFFPLAYITGGQSAAPVVSVVNAEGREVVLAPGVFLVNQWNTLHAGSYPEICATSSQRFRSKDARTATSDYTFRYPPADCEWAAFLEVENLRLMREMYGDASIANPRTKWAEFLDKLNAWLTMIMFEVSKDAASHHKVLAAYGAYYKTEFESLPMSDSNKRSHYASKGFSRKPAVKDDALCAKRYTFARMRSTPPQPANWDDVVTRSEAGVLADIVVRAGQERDKNGAPAAQRLVALDKRLASGESAPLKIDAVGTGNELNAGCLVHVALTLSLPNPGGAPKNTGGIVLRPWWVQVAKEARHGGRPMPVVRPIAVPPGSDEEEEDAGAPPPVAALPVAIPGTPRVPDSSGGEMSDASEGGDPTPSPSSSSDGEEPDAKTAAPNAFAAAGRRFRAAEPNAGRGRKRARTVSGAL